MADDDITGDDFFALADDDEPIQADDDGGEGDDVSEIEQDDFFVDDGVRTSFLTPFFVQQIIDFCRCKGSHNVLPQF